MFFSGGKELINCCRIKLIRYYWNISQWKIYMCQLNSYYTEDYIYLLSIHANNLNNERNLLTFYADVNECFTNNGGCDGLCTDTRGSYTCSCGSGFVLGSNAHSCDGEFIKFQSNHTFRRKVFMIINFRPADVDECSTSNGGCEGQCTNTRGSYTCSCESGYVLGSNRLSCNGKWEHSSQVVQ